MDINARVEQRINQGVLGQWYVVARSADVVPGKPLAATRSGTPYHAAQGSLPDRSGDGGRDEGGELKVD